MYFVHSFHVQPARADVVLSTTRYGHIEFCSSLRRGNVLAFQFHPERSGRQGLRIYQNLAALIANRALTQESGHAA
jgi:glutamine amidotransferase